MKKQYSAFDYTVTITRKHRYLVVGSPEFGYEIPSSCLSLDQATSDAIGRAVLQTVEAINRRLFEFDRSGENPPKPLKARGLASRQLLPSSGAARALGVSVPTLRKMVAARLITAERTPGGHLRVPLDSLAEYLAEGKGAA